ncbi:hypothetical protein IHE61_12655 [Streptomyces sp. GKU 257-1]|nr:hypothetical protein [Streptomyces sp. GKU 257-1]
MRATRARGRGPAGRTAVVLLPAVLAVLGAATGSGDPAAAAERPRPVVAPYYYSLGWGDPPDPGAVLRKTGADGFTFAFMLSAGDCEPRWDGVRPLTGGADERALWAVRVAGGEPVVSFGGGGGRKLEQDCADAAALARAYRKVIRAYGLRARDRHRHRDARLRERRGPPPDGGGAQAGQGRPPRARRPCDVAQQPERAGRPADRDPRRGPDWSRTPGRSCRSPSGAGRPPPRAVCSRRANWTWAAPRCGRPRDWPRGCARRTATTRPPPTRTAASPP